MEPGIAAREGGHIYEGVCGTLRANAGDNQMSVAYPYTLKIRSGCEGGGKGALIQTDLSATLATNNDQYLFQPVIDTILLDDQGGSQIAARTDGKCPTLRAEMHGNIPCVLESAGFCPEQSAKTRGIGFEEEKSPTLRAGVTPAVVCKCYDARGNGDGSTVPTITGDHNNRVTDYTSLLCMAHGQANAEIMENLCPTLNCNHEQPIVAGVDCRNFTETPELYPTLQAKPNGGQSLNYSGAVRTQYIVRRLTPTECARLQGFPDGWGHPDQKDDFTEDEYRFWLNVRNTYAYINGKVVKDYTKAQMLSWYNKLHTDSSEYKMWGNGIALPCALYVMQGIADVIK